jgi:murein DD-endopeptidase MepM/ murein hydrolase activator NlpD
MTDSEKGFAMLFLALMMGKRQVAWGEGWVWPVPEMHQATRVLSPVISQEFRGRTAAHPHYGVDIMYPGGVALDHEAFWMPVGVPALAARAGVVWSTQHTGRGWNVVLDNGPPFATFYQHLAGPPLVRAGQRVAAGDQLGEIGADPMDAAGLRHLHFAVWYKGHGDEASVDPGSVLSSWPKIPWWP